MTCTQVLHSRSASGRTRFKTVVCNLLMKLTDGTSYMQGLKLAQYQLEAASPTLLASVSHSRGQPGARAAVSPWCMLLTLSRVRLGAGREKMWVFLVIFLRSAISMYMPCLFCFHKLIPIGIWRQTRAHYLIRGENSKGKYVRVNWAESLQSKCVGTGDSDTFRPC